MYFLDHEDPHIHVKSPEGFCKINFNGEIMKGYLPANKLRIVKQWIIQHKDELEHNWEISRDHIEPERIKPWIQ
ncbi:MAG: DUF4160 domain-containing protein [Ignavibacteriaceae bacterium]|nr:DUF4160 domain-containing protein [Ignavibacteriaceae bacterium]